MKKLLTWIAGVALVICGFSAIAGNNFNTLDRNSSRDFIADTAVGLVPNTSLVTAFGYSPNTPNTTNINLWALQTAWTPLTAASTMELVSSSASDAAAGTGCRSALIQGLDNDYNQISEFVVPNGITAVALVKSYIVINAATCLVNGSGNVNAGNITVQVTAAGSAQGYIAAGFGASQHGRFTVPAGYTWVLENFFLLSNKSASPSASASITAQFILPGGTVIKGLPLTLPNASSTTITVPTGVAVSEKQTLEFIISSVSVAGLDISAGTSGILVKNP